MGSSLRSASLLLGLLSKWGSQLPDSLRTEDPAVILRVLDCVDATDGISQTELIRRLGLNQSTASKLVQSTVSKLVRKLIRAGYLKESRDRDDRRLQLLKSTGAGRGILYYLESSISMQAQRDLQASNVPDAAAPHVFRGQIS